MNYILAMLPEGVMIFDRSLKKLKFANRASINILTSGFEGENKFSQKAGESTITDTDGNSIFGNNEEPLTKEDFVLLYN